MANSDNKRPNNQLLRPQHTVANTYTPKNAIFNPKETQSPTRNHDNRQLRKPEFLKNIGKGFPQAEEKRVIEERRSFREGQFQARENPVGQQKKQKDSPQKMKVGKAKELRQTLKTDTSEYQRLSDKLNFIQSKINDLSSNIDRKRDEKRQFLQGEKKEREWRLEKHSSPPQNKLKESLKKFVTQVNQGQEFVSCNFNPYSPRHNTYYVTEVLKFHKEERSLAREHLTMSTQYLRIFQNIRMPTQEVVAPKILNLVRKPGFQDKKTVVFDLDETLIHCNDSLDSPYDVKLRIKFPTGEEIEAGINIRPHAVEILRSLNQYFEVIVFTASHSCYANVVLDYLDPKHEMVHHRLFREHCHVTPEGVYVKDLRVINRDPSQLVLVDNAAYSYAFQLDNAIPILPYYRGKNDFELKALQTYLQGLVLPKDAREVNRKTFKLHHYCEFSSVDQLVEKLYSEFQ